MLSQRLPGASGPAAANKRNVTTSRLETGPTPLACSAAKVQLQGLHRGTDWASPSWSRRLDGVGPPRRACLLRTACRTANHRRSSLLRCEARFSVWCITCLTTLASADRPWENNGMPVPLNETMTVRSDVNHRQRNPLQKAVVILRIMVDAPQREWGVRELAVAAGIPAPSLHRLLVQLKAEGLIAQRNGHYRLGSEFLRLAGKAREGLSLHHAALPEMERLCKKLDESVYVGLFDPARVEMMFTAVVHSTHPLRYVVPLFEWMPLHAGASGLAILAFLPDSLHQRAIHEKPLTRVTPRTITRPAQMELLVNKARDQGWVCTHGQRIPGAVGIASPIWAQEEWPVGDLVITVPEERMRGRSESELGAPVLAAATAVSRALGADRL